MIVSADLVDIMSEGLVLVLIVSAPILGAALLAGVVTSILQMFTKAPEQSVSHVVRIVAIASALVVAAPWMAGRVTGFAQRVWSVVQTASF